MTEQEKRWMEIGKAVDRACGELPDGYDLHLELERGAGTVRLYIADTDADIHDWEGDSFAAQINMAIKYAVDVESAA